MLTKLNQFHYGNAKPCGIIRHLANKEKAFMGAIGHHG